MAKPTKRIDTTPLGFGEDEWGDQAHPKRPTMVRGVSQLLFTYLPDRTVDWEDGVAIVRLGQVRLDTPWSTDRAKIVLDEIAYFLDRWRNNGGAVDPQFPDPRRQPGRFTMGTPRAIEAYLLETAFVCQQCHALSYPKISDLPKESLRISRPLLCPICKKGRLRQFPQVFVHGCGELIPFGEYVPGMRTDEHGFVEETKRRVRCLNCGDQGVLVLSGYSERVQDMEIICRTCQRQVMDRITARCPRCTRRLRKAQQNGEDVGNGTAVSRVAMRMTRYSANDTYYPQTITLVRLDNPRLAEVPSDMQEELLTLLPEGSTVQTPPLTLGAQLQSLAAQIADAEARGDAARVARLQAEMSHLLNPPVNRPEPPKASSSPSIPLEVAEDIVKSVRESLAFLTTVRICPAGDLVPAGPQGSQIRHYAHRLQRQLGLEQVALVGDFPVITTTFGYTRRSFEPTYDELNAKKLPTELRVFPSLDQKAANALGRQELAGTVPILARESQHQGIFVSLDPQQVISWLEHNGVTLPHPDFSPRKRLLAALEPVDRYHDLIWHRQVRRWVFGLVHTLSHAVMRATSFFAGLDRTSLSEYLFLPLLGTVVFDVSGVFQLGGIEAMLREAWMPFLERLSTEALDCIYDSDCIDRNGACHGCIHAPEISCRFFNHGLSRAFLMDGHVPWEDVSQDIYSVGYWGIARTS